MATEGGPGDGYEKEGERPIARIVPAKRATKLEQLRAEGRVQRARARKQSAPAPLATGAPVSDLIGKQRR